jgi:hypothetical protein
MRLHRIEVYTKEFPVELPEDAIIVKIKDIDGNKVRIYYYTRS